VPRLCEVYPGIYLTTEEKARKTLSQGSRRMPVGKEKCQLAVRMLIDLTAFSKRNKISPIFLQNPPSLHYMDVKSKLFVA